MTLQQADMWTTHENHTKKTETLGNANQNKTTRRAGYKEVWPPPRHPHAKAFRIKGALWNANKTKALTTIARQKMANENVLKLTSQNVKELYKNHSEKDRALQNSKKNKTTKKSSDRRRPS